MQTKRGKRVVELVVALSMTAGLAACGGGGGGGGAAGTATTNSGPAGGTPGTGTVAGTASADGQLRAACTSCGATSDTAYAGSGVGLWQAVNTGAQSVPVNVSLTGTAGRNVTLVFTNEGSTPQSIAPIAVSANVIGNTSALLAAKSMTAASSTTSSNGEAPGMRTIHEFNATGWKAIAQKNAASASASADVVTPVQRSAVTDTVGSTRAFWVTNDTQTTQRQMTLEAIGTTSDNTRVNVWVETSEYGTGKITSDIVNSLLANYASSGGVYSMVTGVGGPFWGNGGVPGMIGGSQPIDLVVANFNQDNTPYGTVGYFWAMNNFVNQGPSTSTQYSNADLSLYLDSETLYLAGAAGMEAMQTVMAHESTHMQNFYRRDMLMGANYAYATWLEEMTAMMMEDWVSFNIDANYNAIRDLRFPGYLTYNAHGSYTCGLTTWDVLDTTCDSYTTNGSFGGFLNRQLGLDFYKALLNDRKTDSLAALNDAIQQVRSTSSVAQELRHFTAAASAQIPLTADMTEYSFPARTQGGFTLPSIDPSKLTRLLPSAAPTALLSNASFPVVRTNVGATYQETVTLPPGVTLSVIVQ